MPKTPIHVETAKSNPYITKSISKSLLTPCRQVGLSRKKKTPGSITSTSVANSSLTSADVNLQTTPLSSATCSTDDSCASEPAKVQDRRKEKKNRVSKRLIAEEEASDNAKKFCQGLEDLNIVTGASSQKGTDFVEENSENSCKSRDLLERKDEISAQSSSNQKLEDDRKPEKIENKGRKGSLEAKRSGKNKSNNSHKHHKSRRTSDFCEDDKGFNLNNEKKKEGSVGDPKHTEVVNENDSKENLSGKPKSEAEAVDMSTSRHKNLVPEDGRKKNKQPVSVKTDSLQNEKTKDTSVLQDPKHTEVEIVLDESKENLPGKPMSETDTVKMSTSKDVVIEDVTNKNKQPVSIKKDTKSQSGDKKAIKMKRSLSMKKSTGSDMEDKTDNMIFKELTVNLQSLDQDILPIPEDQIKDLQKQIKDKQKLINELHQAEIYRKKHDLKELQELTALWKKGCIAALNDLLPELQKHQALLDMPTLLSNLNIPKEKITLTADGELK